MFSNPYAEMCGYEEKTTFWMDFSIADRFGLDAIKDTYKRAFREWNYNAKYIVELCMVLNWKIWQYYETNEPIARLYDSLWRELDNWCFENLKGEDLSYFLRVRD